MKEKTLCFFAAVAAVFSVCVLILSLMTGIRTAEVNDRAAALEKEIAALKNENEILEARLSMRLSLEEIERRAESELGMRPVRPEQLRLADTEN